jgi:hypothetical protein
MTQRCGSRALRRIAIAGAVGAGLSLAGTLAVADDARGLGRSQPNFGSGLDTSGASGFAPDRRLGDVQRRSPGAKLGDTRDQPDRPREGEIAGSEPRGLNFDDNRRFETSTDEGLTSRGLDHRGAPANKRSPFFPNRLGGR